MTWSYTAREIQMAPGWALASSRAAILTAVTEDIGAVDDHIAEVDADPKPESALIRKLVTDRRDILLHLDGAVQRIDDT